jgi:CRISPR-associated protein Cas2
MRGISDYAVVYDISDDKERRRVDKVLAEYGFRIQKSVYECRMSARLRKELVYRLEHLELASGWVKMYRLEYSLRNTVIGTGATTSPDDGPVFIV